MNPHPLSVFLSFPAADSSAVVMFSNLERRVRSATFLYILFLFFHCMAAFQITGASGNIGPDGERPLRYEIHIFENSGPAFDLFILAVKDLQDVDQSNPLSYFQIAGL